MIYWNPVVWLVSYSIYDALENRVLKTIDNDLNRGLLSFRD